MASSSKPTVSQVEANSLADDWEARVRRFIDNDDEAGFLKDQPVLFKKLRVVTVALSPYPPASSRLLDKLLNVFNDGQESGQDGRPVLNTDFELVKATTAAFDRKQEKKRIAGKAAGGENGKGKAVEGKKRIDAPEKEDAAKGAQEARKAEQAAEKEKAEEAAAQQAAMKAAAEKAAVEKAAAKSTAEEARQKRAESQARERTEKEAKEKGEGRSKRQRADEVKTVGRGESKSPKKPLEHKFGGRMTVQAGRRRKPFKSNSVVPSSDEEVVKMGRKKNVRAETEDEEEEAVEPKGKGKEKQKPAGRDVEVRAKAKRTKVREESEEEEEEEEEEVEKPKSKGKRKAAGQDGEATPKAKRTRVREVSEEGEEGEEEDEDEDGQEEEQEEDEADESHYPLKTAQKRAAEKKASMEAKKKASKGIPHEPPANWFPVDEKCELCRLKGFDCFWTDETQRGGTPKACWKCRYRKVVCHNSFGKANHKPKSLVVDLGTPLNNLVERLAPPPSEADGVPRSGVAGENGEGPTTLGELLVEILTTIRETKEENQELKKEIRGMRRTLDSMLTYDTTMHNRVMEAINGLPSRIRPPPPPLTVDLTVDKVPVPSAPASLQATSAKPQPGASILPRLSDSTRSPRPPLSKIPPATSTTATNRTPPPANNDADNEEFSLIPPRIVLESSDSEDDGTPRPPSSASRATRSPKGQTNDKQEEQTVPSAVADRTRQKRKAEPTPREPSDDGGSDDGGDHIVGKKRKVREAEVEEANPGKKPRAAATKAKAAVTRKPAGKKK